jgi:hypothetical protein
MRILQSPSEELEGSWSPSREIEAFRSSKNFDYDECVRRLALLVQRKDSKTLNETALLMGQLTAAI